MAGLTTTMSSELTAIDGCLRIYPVVHGDVRGSFTKPLAAETRRILGEEFVVAEIFWSVSSRGVIRGLHFQTPPHDMKKIIWVTDGQIQDVVVDLRLGSPSYGQSVAFELNPESGAVVVPTGCAHGLEVLSDQATVVYAQSGNFDAQADAGIRWDSVGVHWHCPQPTLSERDLGFPTLADYQSPFSYSSRASERG